MRRLFAVVGAVVVIAIAVPVVIAVVRGGGTGDAPTAAPSTSSTTRPADPSVEAMYTPPGQCVALDRSPRGITPRRADCGSDGFTFIVAAALPSPTAPCGDGPYSQITQPGFGKLCVVPNFVRGDCYAIPSPTGTLADFRRSACAEPAAQGGQIVRVVQRAAARTVDCPDGQVITFALPTPLAYCLIAAA
jgi:hypothetical protein